MGEGAWGVLFGRGLYGFAMILSALAQQRSNLSVEKVSKELYSRITTYFENI